MTEFRNILKRLLKAFQPTALAQSQEEAFKAQFQAFQNLLNQNNQVLELMADMEEKLSGEYLFDRHYIDANWKKISENVSGIIHNLNILSKDKYISLQDRHADISGSIMQFLARRSNIAISDYTLPLDVLKGEMTNIAGGKMAHLGDLKGSLELPAPEGFAITAYSFKVFMEHNRLSEKITERLSSLNIEDMGEIDRASKEIRDMVINAELPDDLGNAIAGAAQALKSAINKAYHSQLRPTDESCIETGLRDIDKPPKSGDKGLYVSVRSSAIQEDGDFSFAGQYSTFLNVSECSILQRYKEVLSSLFTARAIYYYKTRGFSEEEMVMAAGVLQMIDAMSAGVLYSRDPNEPDRDIIIINAVWGLGKAVVDGSSESDSFIVSRQDGAVLNNKIACKQTMLVCSPKGDIEEAAVPDPIRREPCLTAQQISELCNSAIFLERHYGKPQDIEWAIDRNHRIYILQSRPLRTISLKPATYNPPRRIEKYNILLDRGIIACKGIGHGRAFVITDEDRLHDFPEGAVLVARQASTKFVTVMNKASAIITDIGCATEHMASISREYQIPTILDTEIATSVIRDGQEITVDAINCNIYEGAAEELLAYKVPHSPFKDTHLFKTLENILKWIVPLNLTDHADEGFKAENCRTFHDITRFAHEMSMAEMFRMGGDLDTEGPRTISLRAGIPVDVRLLDIDRGLRSGIRIANPEDILSIPFSAILKGMKTMRWPEPRPADVKGFLSMMAHTASIPDEKLQEAALRSFAVLSANYMNFSIRLGYHFSMIEAYAGENINDNYIKFFFKGGGAATDRRLRRIRLIKEILKKMDFGVSIKEDVLHATLTKHRRKYIEHKLEILGKFTAYTKQLDMVLYNDGVTDWYIEEFVKEHMNPVNS